MSVVNLKVFDGEVVATAQGGDSIYIGTNKGEILQYDVATKAVTVLATLGGVIESMILYSGLLYVGVAGGKLVSVSTT